MPGRPLRVVAVAAVLGGRGQEACFSTDTRGTAEQSITWYALRWSIEVTHHDTTPHLGLKDRQGWTRPSVQRTGPIALRLDTLIVLWFTREGHRHWRPLDCPWDNSKTHPDFPDTLRRLQPPQRQASHYRSGPSVDRGREQSNDSCQTWWL